MRRAGSSGEDPATLACDFNRRRPLATLHSPCEEGWSPARHSIRSRVKCSSRNGDQVDHDIDELGTPGRLSQGEARRLPQPTRISEDALTSRRMPVLAIIDGESVMHDPDTAAEVAERALAHGTVRVYPDASHAINGEHPQELATDTSRFLDRQN